MAERYGEGLRAERRPAKDRSRAHEHRRSSMALRARDVEQPALLGGRLGTAGMGDRDETLLEAGNEDDPPLETFCAVKGHDVDGVADLPRRIGTQARLEPGDEADCTRVRVVPEVLRGQDAELDEIIVDRRDPANVITALGGARDIEVIVHDHYRWPGCQIGQLFEPPGNAR